MVLCSFFFDGIRVINMVIKIIINNNEFNIKSVLINIYKKNTVLIEFIICYIIMFFIMFPAIVNIFK